MSYDEEDFEPIRIDEVKCIAMSKSGTSICCTNYAWDEPVWIAQHLISDDSEVYKKGDYGVLVVPRWLAKKANMI